MAIIHGKAGEGALKKGLRKQQEHNVFVLVFLLFTFTFVGLFIGLGFSRNWWMIIIAFIGMISTAGAIFVLVRKMARNLERQLREARKWYRGAEGECVVAEILETELPDGYHVFNDVKFPGRTANIDHLVIGPSGVFVLDTKNWRGIVGWAEDGKTLLCNGEPEKKNSAKMVLADALDVRDKIRALLNRDIFVKPVLVFPLAKVLPKLDTPVDLQQDNYLVEKRLKYIDKRRALSEKEVKEIVNALTALFRESI